MNLIFFIRQCAHLGNVSHLIHLLLLDMINVLFLCLMVIKQKQNINVKYRLLPSLDAVSNSNATFFLGKGKLAYVTYMQNLYMWEF